MSSINTSTQRTANRMRVTMIALAAFFCVLVLFALETDSVGAKKTGTAAATKSKLPVIYSVTPKKLVDIGQTLTLTGKNFVKGKNAVIVIFQRPGSKRKFSIRGTGLSTKKAKVKVPDVSPDLVRALQTGGEGPLDNLFRLRMVTKFGASKNWTSKSDSPTVNEQSAAAVPVDTGPGGDCDKDGLKNGVDPDDDNDRLDDVTESAIATDLCNPDTDNDDASDYYEWRVALDYNNSNSGLGTPSPLPYPGLRPYPNPLVADSGFDFDGDRLTTHGEYRAWLYTGLDTHFYSDADQDSDNDGIEDGAEDEDGDLLPNLPELSAFQNGSPTRDLNWLKTDTDGDGLCDGLDDQDHDGPPTAVADGDCTTMVPNNGPTGTPATAIGAGDPDGTKIDGDDNRYSNFFEWMYDGADEFQAPSAYDACIPSVYPVSPYCPAPFNPAPWGP